jgi:hypothetical protein
MKCEREGCNRPATYPPYRYGRGLCFMCEDERQKIWATKPSVRAAFLEEDWRKYLLPLPPESPAPVPMGHRGTDKPPATTPVREPSSRAFAAYRAVRMGGQKEATVANELAVSQATVSRDIEKVAAWVEAGNILPEDLRAARPRRKPMAMDPNKLAEGPRLDGRRRSGQRKKDE